MPQSPDFLRRMHSVLEARVEQKIERETPNFLRTRQAVTAVLGALAFFFVLKGAAMATAGVGFAGPLPAEPGFASTARLWFAGPDPVSSTLALALRG